jgi:hypothetical protein
MSTTGAGRGAADQVAAATGSRPPATQVQINDSGVISLYSNFCRVSGTPEELMIDFGLNPQPFDTPTAPIPVTQRIVTNYYTAKRMLHALEMVIQRHEATFGALELNVQRRVRPGAAGQRAGA